MDHDVDRESIQIRCSLSKDWVDDELMDAYPHVTSVSQAARQAVLDGVQAQDAEGVLAKVGSDVIAAMQEAGGEVENCQTVRIGDDKPDE